MRTKLWVRNLLNFGSETSLARVRIVLGPKNTKRPKGLGSGYPANYIVSGPIWPKFELVRDFMHVLVTCKYEKDRIKSNREKVATPFSPL